MHRSSHCAGRPGTLSGEGLLLVPSVMTWPGARKMIAPYQPMLHHRTGPPPALVARSRLGRQVLYRRTSTGDMLAAKR